MKLCRYDADCVGLVQDDRVVDVSDALSVLGEMRWPVPNGDRLITRLDEFRAAAEALNDGPGKLLTEVSLLSPIANPTKIIGAPVNYAKHLDESREDLDRAAVLR